jgi:16S rRNA (guanine1207-N2)-methyltransferase
MTQSFATQTLPAHLIYGTVPRGLVDVRDGAVQVSPLFPEALDLTTLPDQSIDSAVVLAPPGTAERAFVLAQVLRVLKPGSDLTALALKDQGGARLRKGLEGFGCDVYEDSKAHHRIAYCTRPEQTTGIEAAIKTGGMQDLNGEGLWSQPGVFSWDRLDPGSALLLKTLPPLAGDGMDLGCGIGLLAKTILANPKIKSLGLVDIDARAVNAARLNVTDPRAHVIWADARTMEAAADRDFVVMNPPFHLSGGEDRRLGISFIQAAARNLRKGGVCWLVANRHLPYEDTLKTLFSRVEVKAEAHGYKVFEAKK